MTTVCKISGLNSTACSLVQSGFGLPLPSLPVDFTTDLLAKLWSGKTFPVYTESTYWVTLSSFIPLGGNPNDLDLAWRDGISTH